MLRPFGPAVRNVYWASRDLFRAQRFARHVSPLTTTIYTHAGDEEMGKESRGRIAIRCGP